MDILGNAGLPMIGLYWPPAWLAILPVVAIEAWWARRELGNRWGKAVWTTGVANLASTFVGIPMVWFIWAVIQARYFGTAIGLDHPGEGLYAVTVQAAWLTPYEEHMWWMIPSAALVLTVVFCAVSIGMEWLAMKAFQPSARRSSLWRWAWKGNLCSYVVIFGFVMVYMFVPRGSLNRLAAEPIDVIIGWVVRAAT